MAYREDSATSIGWQLFKWGSMIIIVLFLFGALLSFFNIISLVPRTAVGVAERVMNPDAALNNYRWFRDARNGIEAQKANISQAKQAVEQAKQLAPDRVSARLVELTGTQQTCNNLVGQYNARSERLDARLFKDPTQFFTGLVDGQRPAPLPERYDFTACN